MDWLVKNLPVFLTVIIAIIQVVFLGVYYMLHRTYAKHETVNDIEKRVTVLENEIDNLPTDVHAIDKSVREVLGKLDGMERMQSQMLNHISMLMENELSGSRSK